MPNRTRSALHRVCRVLIRVDRARGAVGRAAGCLEESSRTSVAALLVPARLVLPDTAAQARCHSRIVAVATGLTRAAAELPSCRLVHPWRTRPAFQGCRQVGNAVLSRHALLAAGLPCQRIVLSRRARHAHRLSQLVVVHALVARRALDNAALLIFAEGAQGTWTTRGVLSRRSNTA